MKEKHYGLVVRCDNSGLGGLSLNFYNNLPFEKILIIQGGRLENHPERFPEGIICQIGNPTLEEIDRFLKGLDLILTFETPYNWNLFARAKEKGIKTILIPMYEWTMENPPIHPDLYLCPSKLDYDLMPEPKKYLPIPIDRLKIPFRLRERAELFLFNNGFGGTLERNSIYELSQAINLVKSDVKFVIRSQVPVQGFFNNKKIRITFGDIEERFLWNEGDIFLFPHKFDGLCLPINEAMAAGMPTITTDIYPFNEILPKELLFEPEAFFKTRLGQNTREIEIAIISPQKLAEKIDEIANQDIKKYSERMNELAEQWSWKNLRKEYLKVFQEII